MASFDLSNLDWARRGQWPQEIKIGVSVAAFLFGFLVVYLIWISPLRENYTHTLAQEARLKAEFTQKYAESVNLHVYKKQLKDMEAHFGQLLKQLPKENEMPALLEDISKTGIASGLTFELFAPAKEVQHPFYVELPVNITVLGTYHQIAVFLSRVAKINRVVTIHDFTLTALKLDSADKKEEATLKTERLILSVTIKIYRYKQT